MGHRLAVHQVDHGALQNSSDPTIGRWRCIRDLCSSALEVLTWSVAVSEPLDGRRVIRNAGTANRAGVLDEAYERLHRTGPEFAGYLSNHGPMASEALVQLGLGEHVHGWLDGYIGKLEERPAATSRITPDQFADALGDAGRFGDWLDYFQSQVTDRDWRGVLA